MNKYIKMGYTLREDTWGGDLPVGEAKAITHQLFQKNDYWFTMGTSIEGREDFGPRLRQRRQRLSWRRAVGKTNARTARLAGVEVVCKKTGTYFLIVKVEKSPGGTHGLGPRLQLQVAQPRRL